MNKGYLEVYTGDGKGKTTAAIGLAIRAAGAGKRIYFLQFMKEKIYSEHEILRQLSPQITLETAGKPFFILKKGMLQDERNLPDWVGEAVIFEEGNPPEEYLSLVAAALQRAGRVLKSGLYDLVVLDEINTALFFGLVDWTALKEMLIRRNPAVEVILTGRNAPQELLDIADLVTEMKEVKHYYQRGVEARKGIEC